MTFDRQGRWRIGGARVARILALTVVSLIALMAPARAEWFADLYAGWAITEDDDVSVKGRAGGTRVDGKFLDIEFDKTLAVGGRLGYWFERVRFVGVALDVTNFQPTIKSQTVATTGTLAGPFLTIPPGPFTGSLSLRKLDVDVTAASLDLLLRVPLFRSDAFPHGRLSPYVTGGPGAYFTDVRHFDTDVSFGWKAGGGLTWLITKDIGLFAEYRLTHFEPRPHRGRAHLEMTIDTQIMLGGLTVRF